MNYTRLVAVAVLAMLGSCMGGCAGNDGTASASEGRDDAPDNVAANTPPIHLRQTGWTVQNGQPYVQTVYEDFLDKCQKAKFSTVPLGADVVDKLGRTYYEIWFDGAQVAITSVSWGFVSGDGVNACHFKAVRSERAAVANTDGAYGVNLDKQSAVHDPDFRVVRFAVPTETAAERAADAKEEAAVRAEMKKQGYGQLADDAASTYSPAQVAGQPCSKRVSRLDGASCIWSGGRRWGFTDE